jgi:archaellum biogenesis ATPase FlaH
MLNFEKDVYENIHNDEVDGEYREFLIHLTQEGIAEGVGTKQTTVYKELQLLREPALKGEEPLINIIERIRIPGKERACAIYYLTQYGLDLATQKRSYLEEKNLEVFGLNGENEKVISLGEVIKQYIIEGHESNPITALLTIATLITPDGGLNWQDLISARANKLKPEQAETEEPISVSKPSTLDLKDMVNPYFNRTAIKNPKYFYGREREIRYITSLLRNSQSCSIVGPRRIGKSSLINYISHPEVLKKFGLNPKQYIFVSIDLEGLSELTQSDLFRIIIRELRNRITDNALRKHAENLLQNEDIRFLSLKEMLEEISNLGKNVIFLLDEFELITNNKNLDANFFSGLRNLANSYNVGYITASNVQLPELTLSQETLGSPFFNFFTQVDLGLLDEDAVHELIIEPAKEHKIEFSKEVIDFIKFNSGSHPFFIQLLCFLAFNSISEKQQMKKEAIQEIYTQFMDEARPHFQYFWDHLASNEQQLLQQLSITGSGKLEGGNQSMIRSLKRKAMVIEKNEDIHVYSGAFQDYLSSIASLPPDKGRETQVTDRVEAATSTTTQEIDRPSSIETLSIGWGNSYFVDEEDPEYSVKLFNEITNQDVRGLFISRTPIQKAKEQWALKNSKTIWLCTRSGSDFLRPVLEKISHMIHDFVNQNKLSVVFLDGIEFIINNNDFLKTLNFLDSIKENIAINNSVLVFPLSSTIFSEKEIALMAKNSVHITRNAKFDFSKLKDKSDNCDN